MQNLERMRELIQTINEADEAYYKYDAPIMADLDYDRLYDELVALERETGTILSSSPTQRVSGEVLESLTAVRHTRPMLSADKCKSVADIHKYLGGHEAVLSWKLDGLTLVLRYLDCYAEGRIQPECEKKRWHLGTYKTLETSLSTMQTLGALGGALTYFASEYLWENGERFLSNRDLRIRALQKRQKEEEAEKS